MNIKRLMIIGLVLVAVISTMAVISAETSTELNMTLDGIEFKIPEGYSAVEQDLDAKEAGDTEDIDGTAVDTEVTSEFKNAAGDELELKVGSRDKQKIDSINPANGQNKTINGKEGYLIKEIDDGKDKYSFEYLQDGKIVKITAVSEDIISKVIV